MAGIAAGSLIGSSTASANSTEARARLTGITPAGFPAVDGYTPGIIAEGRKWIFVSGRGPRDRTADMETQMRQTLESIGKVLEAAGASMKDIVNLRCYFVNIDRGLPAYRKVRKEYLAQPYPACTAVGVAALASPDLQVEIEAVAVL